MEYYIWAMYVQFAYQSVKLSQIIANWSFSLGVCELFYKGVAITLVKRNK